MVLRWPVNGVNPNEVQEKATVQWWCGSIPVLEFIKLSIQWFEIQSNPFQQPIKSVYFPKSVFSGLILKTLSVRQFLENLRIRLSKIVTFWLVKIVKSVWRWHRIRFQWDWRRRWKTRWRTTEVWNLKWNFPKFTLKGTPWKSRASILKCPQMRGRYKSSLSAICMAVHYNILFRLDAAIKADFVRVKPKVNEATVNDYVQVKILIFKILLTRGASQPIRSAFGG